MELALEDFRDTGTVTSSATGVRDHQSRPPGVNINLSTLGISISNYAAWHEATMGRTPFTEFTRELASQIFRNQAELNRQSFMETKGPSLIYTFMQHVGKTILR